MCNCESHAGKYLFFLNIEKELITKDVSGIQISA